MSTTPSTTPTPNLSSDAVAQLILQHVPSLSITSLQTFYSAIQQVYTLCQSLYAQQALPLTTISTALVQVFATLLPVVCSGNPLLLAALLEINATIVPLVVQEMPAVVTLAEEAETEVDSCCGSFWKWICCKS